MSNLKTLLKKGLKESYSQIFNFKAINRNPKKRNKLILNTLIILFSFGILGSIIIKLTDFYDIFSQINQQELFLMMIFTFFGFSLIFFTVPYIVSKIYFSEDTDILLSMPIDIKDIVSARVIAIGISNLILGFFMCLPFIIKYGISENTGLIYYIYSILNILIVNFSIVFSISIIILLIMSIINLSNRMKDILKFLGMIIMITVIVIIQVLTQSVVNSATDTQEIIDIINNSESIINKVSTVLINVKFSVKSIVNYDSINGLIYLLASFSIMILIYFLLRFISGKFLLNGIKKEKEIKKNKKIKSLNKSVKINTVPVALAKRELKLVLKTPIYLFNTLFLGILMPVVMALPAFVSLLKEGIEISTISFTINEFISQINFFELLPYVILIGFGFGGFIGVLSSILSSTFSREGKKIWILQVLPIKAMDQIIGRLLANEIALFFVILPSLLLSLVLVRFPIYIYLIFILSVLVVMIPFGLLHMQVDLIMPKLDWTNPQEAMKQNFGIFVSIMLSFALIGLTSFVGVKFIYGQFENIAVLIGYFIVVIILVTIILLYTLNQSIKKKFNYL